MEPLPTSSASLKKRLWLISAALAAFHLTIFGLVLINTAHYPILLGLIVLAYGLGLRHAVDPDHIAAIDNVTRKLMQQGQQPVGVGFFFAWGHSTIIILMCAAVALSAQFVNQHMPAFKETGSLISTTASCLFLLLIGIINLFVLNDTVKTWRQVRRGEELQDKTLDDHLNQRGLITQMVKPLLNVVIKSWHMFPVGLLFGLGFDTASEVSLLSISGSTGASGAMPFWVLMLIPLSFTAGMSLIDTLDGILMLRAYGWAFLKPVRKLYYNMVITFTSVVIALLIGGIEGLQIISKHTGATGSIWNFANNIHLENWGYFIIAVFVVSWLISMLIYRLKNYDQMAA